MNRALLLTDVVDSTKLAEQLGDVATARIWAAHDRVARDLLRDHGGREIDKTDGFLLLFDRADDAVAYAVAYHRAIGALDPPLKARAGLHVGPVILTENTPADVARGAKPLEVDGVAKPTAARVMSVALGGQTLLTRDAADALGPTSLRLASHGHWRMKGVAEPLELLEVGDEHAPMTPPPDGAKVWRVVARDGVWLPVREVRHQLPAERDAFVGRASDLRALADLLDEARLVSVLGFGGTGKTRLVTRFAWTWLGDFPGGAWFCDLSEARSVDGVCHAVAAALDVPLGKDDPVVQLGHAIAGRGECLVVLDNFEQVARHAGETLGKWLDRARDARFVVTTREILGLPGETALPLAPLAADDATGLFVARARQAKPDFVPSDMASIQALVQLLDGLPLAIELAAARVRVMPPKTLLARMSERFKLLASSGGRHTRQATLRGALDWSWELLSTDEKAALAQLSVFEGGFTLEAAEAVLALAEAWPMDAVQALVDKSLVRQVGEERFDLLVTVHEYATEKLDASGERAEAEERHRAWCAELASEDALRALKRHGGSARLAALRREVDNLVVACRRAVTAGATEHVVALLLGSWAVLELTGPMAVALSLADEVAAMPRLSPRDAAWVDRTKAAVLAIVGRMEESGTLYHRALDAAKATGDPRFEALLHHDLATLYFDTSQLGPSREHHDAALAGFLALGDRQREGSVRRGLSQLQALVGRIPEALVEGEACLAIAREVGDRAGECAALRNLSRIEWLQGNFLEARRVVTDAVAIAAEIGDRRTSSTLTSNRALLLHRDGDYLAALREFQAALETAREVGDRRFEVYVLATLGTVKAELGRYAEAEVDLRAALPVHREVGNRAAEGHVLGALSTVCSLQGRGAEAQAACAEALAIAREVGDRKFECNWLGELGNLKMVAGDLVEGRAMFEAALAMAKETNDLNQQGRLLCGLARLAGIEGKLEEAEARLVDADGALRDTGDRMMIARIFLERAHIQTRAGDKEGARASLAEGRAIAGPMSPQSLMGQGFAKAELLVVEEAG